MFSSRATRHLNAPVALTNERLKFGLIEGVNWQQLGWTLSGRNSYFPVSKFRQTLGEKIERATNERKTFSPRQGRPTNL